ncbi:MAG: heavy metal translocating P-type ATPase [Clostridia bacterium]|nr:heavy metal translocating P-type ATPase [Clostridia bacterium]MDD4376252.1 heavy metal translocating P-type ATPase [Clostridia bacterium]
MPIIKEKNDKVISGTINKSGYIKVKITRLPKDSTLSEIIKLVGEASNSKAPISKLADKISYVFVPIVISISIIATIVWLLLGYDFEFAMSIGIAVLVISCPCALGLATPVAIMVGIGKGAENGILIKTAESLEILSSIDTIVLDKTGTITSGKPEVTDIISFNNTNKKELLKIMYSLESKSEHPLAEAINKKAKEEKIEKEKVDEFLAVVGKGIQGKIKSDYYIVGSLKFMEEKGLNIKDIKDNKSYEKQGKTLLYLAKNQEFVGAIAVKDNIKETSKEAIKSFKKRNLKVIMLTGDNKYTAEAVKNEVLIKEVISEVMPQDKEKVISKLQKEGNRVLMCGDGTNDSPSLAKADVGIAVGTGTDIAIESADIVIVKDDLRDVVTAMDLSKAVMGNIKQNLFWAFFYNVIGIPIAAGMLYIPFGLKLSPMIGAAAMSMSSVCVVLNALRIKRFKSK